MYKQTKNAVVLLSIIAAMASCGAKKYAAVSTKTMDITTTGVAQKPVIVDLDIKQTKVSGSAVSSKRIRTEDGVKNAALADALQKSGADVLIEAKYEITGKGKRISVTVTGWPANYKNFRNITIEELPLLEAGKVQRVNTTNTNSPLNLGKLKRRSRK